MEKTCQRPHIMVFGRFVLIVNVLWQQTDNHAHRVTARRRRNFVDEDNPQ